ncbi:P3a protein, partial [Phasey bean mild yellows virus]
IDYKFLAGFSSGLLAAIPVTVVGLYFVYLKISSHVRAIVNEYGRG